MVSKTVDAMSRQRKVRAWLISSTREPADRRDAPHPEGASRGVRAGEPRLGRAHELGGRPLVRAGLQDDDEPLRTEAMQAYQECLAERMQMGAEDGRRLAKQCEEVMQRITAY